MQIYLTCAPGLQQILKKELQILGYQAKIISNTALNFEGDEFAIAQTNLRLRTANKVYLQIAKQKVENFDQLFEYIYSQDRKRYIDNFQFIIKALSNNSKLSSTPTIQSISEKAIHKKLKNKYLPPQTIKKPELSTIEILLFLENDICTILLNTSGESLHKRGYKTQTWKAPLNEALAAGLILTSGWKFHEPFYDIFCWSGTIPIEAAMIAKNIAPGAYRNFAFQNRKRYDTTQLEKAKNLAKEKILTNKKHNIIWSDTDEKMILIAKKNAEKIWVNNYIQFEVKDYKEYLTKNNIQGTLISNPPYGERMHIKNIQELYQNIKKIFEKNQKLNWWIITGYKEIENVFFTQEKNLRKISKYYNGGMLCKFLKRK